MRVARREPLACRRLTGGPQGSFLRRPRSRRQPGWQPALAGLSYRDHAGFWQGGM